ncbi:MAG: hypothetical protein FWG53_00925, partial [Clostridiales bacterium]|nr:hypothetical protein [Clostridiales bacterium]
MIVTGATLAAPNLTGRSRRPKPDWQKPPQWRHEVTYLHFKWRFGVGPSGARLLAPPKGGFH